MADKKRGLGRGFDSLIPTQLVDEEFDITAEVDNSGKRTSIDQVFQVRPSLVDPNPHQPRENFDIAQLNALAASIRVHGILQPLVVTRVGMRYELIAGERRLRASKIAELDTVPVIVRSFDEQQKLELALIENLQRAELNPMEMATAYRKLLDQFGLTYDQIGSRVGKDKSTVANTTRLLNLPIEAKRAIVEGAITEGHGRVILSILEPEKQVPFLELIIKNRWNVRQSEEFARGFRGTDGSTEKAQARINSTNDLTRTLGDFLGTKVTQMMTAKGGKLVIEYYSDEELDRIYKTIRREEG
jgi:ParB family chromosome partitioning protein